MVVVSGQGIIDLPALLLQVLTGKRASIISAINEVEAARQEDVWLAAYEADDQRYKVGCRVRAHRSV